MMLHKHAWRYIDRGTGIYQKGEQQLEVPAQGHVAECKCGKRIFFPDHPRLNPVEVDIPDMDIPQSDIPSGCSNYGHAGNVGSDRRGCCPSC